MCGAQGEGRGQRQSARTSDDEHRGEGLEALRRLTGRQPGKSRARRHRQHEPGESAAVAIGQRVQVLAAPLEEGLLVPEGGQVALGDRLDGLDLDGPAELPAAGIKMSARRSGDRFGFARDEAVIDEGLAADEPRIGGNEVAVAQEQTVPGLDEGKGHGRFAGGGFSRHGERKKALVVPVEGHALLRFLLKHAAAKQKKHQAGQ